MELYDNLVAFRTKKYVEDLKGSHRYDTYWEDGFVRLDCKGNIVNPGDKVVCTITCTDIAEGIVKLPKKVYKGFVSSLVIDTEYYWRRQIIKYMKIVNLELEPDEINQRSSILSYWSNNHYNGTSQIMNQLTNIVLYNSIYLIK